MNIKPDKCINCGKLPTVVPMGDVAYVQCDCGKWNPYQFCGARPEYAVKQWNEFNASGYRINHGGGRKK